MRCKNEENDEKFVSIQKIFSFQIIAFLLRNIVKGLYLYYIYLRYKKISD